MPPKKSTANVDAEVGGLYNLAGIAASRGDWRGCADYYLRAFAAGTPGSYCAWSGFTSVLREERFSATPDDVAELTRVAEDGAASALHRGMASFTRGYVRWTQGNREAAIRDYGRAIEVCRGATQQEQAARVMLPDPATRQFAPMLVGGLLQQLSEDAAANIRVFGGSLADLKAVMDSNSQKAAAGLAAEKLSVLTTSIPIGPRAPRDPAALQALKDEVSRRTQAAGLACDACRAEPAAGGKLKKCSRCRMAFYCDANCQAAAWKRGHKASCRLPGVFAVGDWVRNKTFSNNLGLRALFEVMEASSQAECKIGLICGDGTGVMVPMSSLEHVRPKH